MANIESDRAGAARTHEPTHRHGLPHTGGKRILEGGRHREQPANKQQRNRTPEEDIAFNHLSRIRRAKARSTPEMVMIVTQSGEPTTSVARSRPATARRGDMNGRDETSRNPSAYQSLVRPRHKVPGGGPRNVPSQDSET